MKKNKINCSYMISLKDSLILEQINNGLSNFIDSPLFSTTINNVDASYPKVFDDPIAEGLIKSYGHKMLINALIKTFNNDDTNLDYLKEIEMINSNEHYNALKLTFSPEFFKKGELSLIRSMYDGDALNSILNVYGYFVTVEDLDKNYIIVEPRYSENLTNNIYTYDYIYHVTEHQKLNKILKNGLNPKSGTKGSRNYSKRIYLLYSDDFEWIKTTAKRISIDRRLVRPILLKIKLDKSRQISFYKDPTFKDGAIYTYDNINPNDIEVLDIKF